MDVPDAAARGRRVRRARWPVMCPSCSCLRIARSAATPGPNARIWYPTSRLDLPRAEPGGAVRATRPSGPTAEPEGRRRPGPPEPPRGRRRSRRAVRLSRREELLELGGRRHSFAGPDVAFWWQERRRPRPGGPLRRGACLRRSPRPAPVESVSGARGVDGRNALGGHSRSAASDSRAHRRAAAVSPAGAALPRAGRGRRLPGRAAGAAQTAPVRSRTITLPLRESR